MPPDDPERLAALLLEWEDRRAAGRPAIRAAGLIAFALPLAACPYWVTVSPRQRLEPAIAYHQMLPVVGLCLLAWATVSTRSLRAPLLALSAGMVVFFSLAYASGAAVLFLFGAALGLLSWIRRRDEGAHLLVLAAVVTLGAGLCLALHIGMATAR